MKQLVLASNNAKKLKELDALLAPLGYTLIPQGELSIPEAEEPHPTFIENALAKARHASHLSGLPALADDSGLCVRALGGAPGVLSARYAGDPKSDARNNAKLLADLAEHGVDEQGEPVGKGEADEDGLTMWEAMRETAEWLEGKMPSEGGPGGPQSGYGKAGLDIIRCIRQRAAELEREAGDRG